MQEACSILDLALQGMSAVQNRFVHYSAQFIANDCAADAVCFPQAGASLTAVTEQLVEELDTVPQLSSVCHHLDFSMFFKVLIALRKAVELAEQSADVISTK